MSIKKYIIYILLLLPAFAFSQEVFVEAMDIEGEITNVKLDLAEFERLATLFSVTDKLQDKIVELEKRIEILESNDTELSPLSQSIVEAIKADIATEDIAAKFYVSHYKQLASELKIKLRASKEKDIIEELKEYFKSR